LPDDIAIAQQESIKLVAILRPFIDQDVDRSTLECLAQSYPELDIPSVETCLAFLQVTADVQTALESHFNRYGLSMGKFTLLMQLYQAGPAGLTPSACATRTRVSRATITGLLDGLERAGLVMRHPSSRDRRSLGVCLTETGQQLMQQMLPDHFCRTTELMAHLSHTEKQTLVKLLQKLRAGTSAMLIPKVQSS
jgi:DNA-binding MarR family transcriptional regulator